MLNNATSTPTRKVKSVEKAFNLISILQNSNGSTVGELADELDLAKSTVHNYVGTLQSLGYVVEKDSQYHLGLRFLTHGMAAKSALQIRDVVSQVLNEVSDKISYPVWWIVEELGRGTFVERFTPENIPEVYGRVGKRSYLHTHAPGKAILAGFPDGKLEDISDIHGLPALTKQTTTDLASLYSELETIRDQNYAVSDGEAALGVQSIGVAFKGPYEYFHGVGIFGYSNNISSRTRSDVVEALENAAVSITGSFSPQRT
jgi:DNA-binding IclR family transcriptional regulator